jgi:hypothetical protein
MVMGGRVVQPAGFAENEQHFFDYIFGAYTFKFILLPA